MKILMAVFVRVEHWSLSQITSVCLAVLEETGKFTYVTFTDNQRAGYFQNCNLVEVVVNENCCR